MGERAIERTRTVLIVEDDAQLLAAYKRALDTRFETLAAPSCKAARMLADHNRLDIAIVDMQLRDESGLSLISHLRAVHPKASIAMITGYGSIEAGADAIRAGADHVMAKPVSFRELLHRLDGNDHSNNAKTTTPSIDRAMWEHIMRVMKDCGGNKSRAARLLRINRSTLQRWLRRPAPRG